MTVSDECGCQSTEQAGGVRAALGWPPLPSASAAHVAGEDPAYLSVREPGPLLEFVQGVEQARCREGAVGVGPTGLSDIPTG